MHQRWCIVVLSSSERSEDVTREEAKTKVSENLAIQIQKAHEGYQRAWVGVSPDQETGTEWFKGKIREYQTAQSSLSENDHGPAVILLNTLINSMKAVGLTDRQLCQGKYPLIPLRDGLLGIDTPVVPDDPPKRPSLFSKLFFRVAEAILG